MFYQIPYRKNCGLRFIGNLPVSEGDLVWTDGNVIFGHIPRKNTPSIPVEQPAFPVEGFLNFQGFISQTGNYHYRKNFIVDNWIVNNKDNFIHGSETQDGQRIIDALITDNNDVFIAKEGFYLKNQTAIYHHPLWNITRIIPEKADSLQDELNRRYPFASLYRIRCGAGDTFHLGPQNYLGNDKNDDIVILKNDIEIDRLNLKSFADLTVDEALSVRDKIMAQSVKEGFNLMNPDIPPDSFIASVFARPLAFNIKSNGDWDALITTSAYGFCFPYFSFDYSMFTASFPNGENEVFSENLNSCMTFFEQSVFEAKHIPIEIERYPVWTGDKTDNDGNFLPEYQQYILDKCAYYIPRARFRHNLWMPALFNASFLFKLHNGELVDTLREYSGGGISTDNLECVECDETQMIRAFDSTQYRHRIRVDTKDIRKSTIEFPIDDNYYFVMNDARITAIHNNQGEKILDLSELQNLDFGLTSEYYVNCPPIFGIHYIKDSNVYSWASRWGVDVETILNSRPRFFAEVGGSSSLIYKIYSPDAVQPELDTIYIVPDFLQGHCGWLHFRRLKLPVSTTYDLYVDNMGNLFNGYFDWIRIKPCFAELKGGQFLFGLRGYPLYKIDAQGNAKKIGEELKNFRLNTLKHKSKAFDS